MALENLSLLVFGGITALVGLLAVQVRLILRVRGASAFAWLCLFTALFAVSAACKHEAVRPETVRAWAWAHEALFFWVFFWVFRFAQAYTGAWGIKPVNLLFVWALLGTGAVLALGPDTWVDSLRAVEMPAVWRARPWGRAQAAVVLTAVQIALELAVAGVGLARTGGLLKQRPAALSRGMLLVLLAVFAAVGADAVLSLTVERTHRLLPFAFSLLFPALAYVLIKRHAQEQDAMEHGHARLEAVLRVLPDRCLVLDEKGVCLEPLGGPGVGDPEAGPRAGQTLAEAFAGEAADIVAETLRWSFVTGQAQTCGFPLPAGAGGTRWLEGRISPLAWPAPGVDRPRAALFLYRDVTTRHAAEARLRQSLEQYGTLFHMSADALFTFDLEGRALEHNARAPLLFGGNAGLLQNRSLRDLFADGTGDAYRAFMAVLLREGTAGRESTFRRADGSLFPGEIRAAVTVLGGRHVVQVRIRDLSARQRTFDRLLVATKMEGIAQLARGLAHSYNNLLVGITGGASLLRMLWRGSAEAEECIAIVEKAGERGADMAKRLQDLSGENTRERAATDVWAAVREAADLVQHAAPAGLTVETVCEAASATTLGDPAQIREALVNLGMNARDAMPADGRLSFRLLAQEILQADRARHPGCRAPGLYLAVRVEDTGVGMPPEVMRRIFEPFFTTKPGGAGTGLGLAMVYAAAQEHGGFVEAESRVGVGTVMTLWLPATGGAAAAPAAPDAAVAAPRGHGHVLLVDDDPVARETTRHLLAELGFEVTVAPGGEEAVRLYGEHQASVDLVLLDVMMPDMTGRDCLQALRAMNPAVRVVFATGHDGEARAAADGEAGVLGVVRKPYTLATLGAALNRLMGGGAP